MKYLVTYSVHDLCSIVVDAENEQDARDIVMSGDFEEDETYDFINAEITGVNRVEPV